MSSKHKGHRDRVRQSFLKQGMENMHDHQILEMILFYGLRQGDTNVIAHDLIDRFGNINYVFDARIEQLMEVNGIGENCAVLLKMIPQIARHYFVNKVSDDMVNSTEKVGNYFIPRFIGATEEMVLMACVDNKCKILECSVISQGDVSSTKVNVRKMVEIVLKNNASGVFVAHNHPGGLALPSKEDIATTRKMQDALKMVNVELLDHVIIADGDFVSLMQSGLMKGDFNRIY